MRHLRAVDYRRNTFFILQLFRRETIANDALRYVYYAFLIVRVDNIFIAERIEEELNAHEPRRLSIEKTERTADGHAR